MFKSSDIAGDTGKKIHNKIMSSFDDNFFKGNDELNEKYNVGSLHVLEVDDGDDDDDE